MSVKTELAIGTPTIVAQNLTVRYRSSSSKRNSEDYTFGQKLASRILGRTPMIETDAVKDISFVARTGESIGLLGTNGAGKSTLLRQIAGTETPTSGRIYSRSTPVLQGVGAALLPDLSGFENARLGCLAMGMTPEEADAALPGIFAFADIGEAIYRPMRTYSSGMGARLRFAISTAKRPQILLVDEALSTGDATFTERSQERMAEMLTGAGTIILVSHSATVIEQTCNRAMWMDHGRLVADGPVKDLADAYRLWARYRANGYPDHAKITMERTSENFPPQKVNILD